VGHRVGLLWHWAWSNIRKSLDAEKAEKLIKNTDFTKLKKTTSRTYSNGSNHSLFLPFHRWRNRQIYLKKIYCSYSGTHCLLVHLWKGNCMDQWAQWHVEVWWCPGRMLDCMLSIKFDLISGGTVVIVTGYTLFVTSQYDFIFTFANQSFGEVYSLNVHIILHALSLLVVALYNVPQ